MVWGLFGGSNAEKKEVEFDPDEAEYVVKIKALAIQAGAVLAEQGTPTGVKAFGCVDHNLDGLLPTGAYRLPASLAGMTPEQGMAALVANPEADVYLHWPCGGLFVEGAVTEEQQMAALNTVKSELEAARQLGWSGQIIVHDHIGSAPLRK